VVGSGFCCRNQLCSAELFQGRYHCGS
jgi:hypothetical protein